MDDDLYAVAPEEFVARRDELVRSLRASGDRAAADAVAVLRKPSVVAWAVNQAVRRSPDLVEALLASGDALRAAQEAAVSGRGGDLRAAAADRRTAIGRLAAVAGDVLREAGRPAYADAVAATLEAATVDEAVADALRAGRLEREQAPVGLGFGTLPEDWAPPAAATPAGPPPKALKDLEAAEKEADRLAAAASDADAEVTRLRAEVAQAGRVARDARKQAQKAALAADRLRHEVWAAGERDR